MNEDSANPRPRQAVVLIHGIGDQRPMTTLNDFVAWLLPSNDGCNYYSKPDRIGGSFELRRIKLKRLERRHDPQGQGLNADWPQTDFYEYYWAHQMYGTTVSHVLRWMVRLLHTAWRDRRTASEVRWLLRPGCRGPIALMLAGALAVVLAVLVVGPVLQSWLTSLGIAIVLAAVSKGAASFGRFALLDVVGDAARYLDVHPTNVARRYDILRGGVEMLRKLHELRDEGDGKARCRYGRIVLVGHSLGSVIAYDIAKHYWAEVNGHLPIDTRTDGLLDRVAQFAMSGREVSEADQASFWSDQASAWASLNGQKWFEEVTPAENPAPVRWLVTDLVTLGSPLAYARFLLADGPGDFEHKVERRELPTCPPNRSTTIHAGYYTVPLSAEAEPVGKDHQILHHAAQFAVTRWTNIHLPNDPIGYRLEHLGRGICELKVEPCADGPSMFRAHTSYWRTDPKVRDTHWNKKIHDRMLAILKQRVYE